MTSWAHGMIFHKVFSLIFLVLKYSLERIELTEFFVIIIEFCKFSFKVLLSNLFFLLTETVIPVN